eukprot:5589689-Amphidinium_carterae.1
MHVFARTGRTKPSTDAAISKRHWRELIAVERQLVDNKWHFHVLGVDAPTLGLLTCTSTPQKLKEGSVQTIGFAPCLEPSL